MTQRIWRITITLVLAAISSVVAQRLPSASPEDVGMSSERLGRIKMAMQRYVDEGKVAGLLTAVARRGKIVHFETYGMKDIENKEPMTRDTIFRIYSMTKPITSVAAMILYEEGRFELDDPVAEYIPEFRNIKVFTGGTVDSLQVVEPERPMTIHDLFRHTAGLTYTFGPTPIDSLYRAADLWNREHTLQQMMEKLGHIPLLHQPGREFHYSVAVDVLGHLVEVVSGMPFDRFLEERVFKPLRMNDTGFCVPAAKLNRLATHYEQVEGGGLKAADKPDSSEVGKVPLGPSGGGGLFSTADDYLRFSQMMLNGGQLVLPGKSSLQVSAPAKCPRFPLGTTCQLFPPGSTRWSEGIGAQDCEIHA